MEKKLVLPCMRGLMGDWVYYSTVMSASEIAKWIQPVKNIREASTLDEVLQRDLKDRKRAIARYLLHDKNRFFNSLVVGVFGGVPDWFEFDLSKTDTIIPLNNFQTIKQTIGVMVFSGTEQMFAIDGQHRVAGIQIAVDDDKNNILADDQFSVILVAHVDDGQGMKRTRKLFSDINKNAKPVAGGDKIKIDEEDLCSIVTRQIYANLEYFDGGQLISLTENAKLEKNDSSHFTNLLGLHSTNKVLKKLHKKAPKTQEWDEANVNSFYNIVEEFYEFAFNNVANYKSFFIDRELDLVKAREKNSYLLFRPIGLKLIAGLYVHFKQQQDGVEKLKAIINSLSFVCPNGPFDRVLWNNGKMDARDSSQKLALELALYLLHELPIERESILLSKYREVLKDPYVELPIKL